MFFSLFLVKNQSEIKIQRFTVDFKFIHFSLNTFYDFFLFENGAARILNNFFGSITECKNILVKSAVAGKVVIVFLADHSFVKLFHDISSIHKESQIKARYPGNLYKKFTRSYTFLYKVITR